VPPPSQPTVADLQAQAAISSRAIRLSDLSKPPVAHGANTPPATPDAPDAQANAHAPASSVSLPTDDRWARYRICPKCNFSFCLYCSATWHGPHTPCAFPQTSALVLEYLSYPEGSRQRADMEARRGKTNLERMVAKWQEDEANKKWLENSTRACAGCGVRVEKSHGCNHMTCGRCGTHFCYRCGKSVSLEDRADAAAM
jgi:E3 ubiquitin-protein ligase RNF14